MTDKESTTLSPEATKDHSSGEARAATEVSAPPYSVVDVPPPVMNDDGEHRAFMPDASQYIHWSPPPTYGSSTGNNVSSDVTDRKERPSSPPADSAIDMPPIEHEHDMLEFESSVQTDKEIRLAFVRKVYCLLSLQLSVTIGVSIWFRNHEVVKEWVSENSWLFFVSWLVAFGILILMYWKRKSFPVNLILLLSFTLCVSYAIGTIVAAYDGKVVLQAFLITLGVFVALVIFTFQTKIDFSSWGPFLYAALWIIILGTVIGWLFPFDRVFHIAISGLAALIFCAYIIYDTYNIANKLSPEEYVMGAIDLYLDIVSLFVALLAIITGIEAT